MDKTDKKLAALTQRSWFWPLFIGLQIVTLGYTLGGAYQHAYQQHQARRGAIGQLEQALDDLHQELQGLQRELRNDNGEGPDAAVCD